jgi:hypothetical protein
MVFHFLDEAVGFYAKELLPVSSTCLYALIACNTCDSMILSIGL